MKVRTDKLILNSNKFMKLKKIGNRQKERSHSSTTMRWKMALWFLSFSFGFRPKQVYRPPSSKVMFHNKMEMLFSWFFPTNSTRSLNMLTFGTTPSEGITDSQTWKDQQSTQLVLYTLWKLFN